LQLETDDCGDALVTTVVYAANSTEDSIACTSTSQIGANAFQCVYATSLTDTRGWYNSTMIANRTLHYTNSTINFGDPGLFYLFPKKKLETPTGNSSRGDGPATQGWGSPDWNFSVVASSGDIDSILNVSLYMAQNVNPTTACSGPVCVNQTPVECDASVGCVDQPVVFYRNFTSNQQGTWYYQFKFNDTALTSTSGTDFAVIVEKDDTNMTYGGAGNASNITQDTAPAYLAVRVYDLDKGSFNVTNPGALVTFRLNHSSYNALTIGTAVTNESGYAEFFFNATECTLGGTSLENGDQMWYGEILSNESNYKVSISEEYNISLELTSCAAAINILDPVVVPTEVFEGINLR